MKLRSRTFISMLLACAVMFSLASPVALVAASDPLANLPSDTDKGIEIQRTAFAPDIDGLLDEDIYTEIYSFSGEDAWNAAPAGGNTVEYGLLTIPATAIERYILGGNNPDFQLECLINSHVKGYAAWDSEKVYFLVSVDAGDAPVMANEDCYWAGNCIQVAVNPKDGPDLVANSNGGGQMDHILALDEVLEATAHTANDGAYGVYIEDQDYAAFCDVAANTVTYEWSYDLADFEMDGVVGEEMLFAILHNFNAYYDNDDYDWFGYQVGTGVASAKDAPCEADHRSLKNSLYLVFSDGVTEVPDYSDDIYDIKKGTPEIDGVLDGEYLDSAVYAYKASEATGFQLLASRGGQTGEAVDIDLNAYILYDDEYVYVGIHGRDDDPIGVTLTNNGEPIDKIPYQNDHVAIGISDGTTYSVIKAAFASDIMYADGLLGIDTEDITWARKLGADGTFVIELAIPYTLSEGDTFKMNVEVADRMDATNWYVTAYGCRKGQNVTACEDFVAISEVADGTGFEDEEPSYADIYDIKKGTPEIDGFLDGEYLDSAVYAYKASEATGFQLLASRGGQTGEAVDIDLNAYILYDDEYVYVGIHGRDDDPIGVTLTDNGEPINKIPYQNDHVVIGISDGTTYSVIKAAFASDIMYADGLLGIDTEDITWARKLGADGTFVIELAIPYTLSEGDTFKMNVEVADRMDATNWYITAYGCRKGQNVAACEDFVATPDFAEIPEWFDENLEKYEYEVIDGKVIITDVDESISGDVVIPAFIQGYPVVEIANYAFSDCDNVTGIVISEGVLKIGTDAFSGCDNLKSVAIADSVTSIGSYAFMHCVNLTEISLPANLTAISDSMFYNCNSLKRIEIPDGVQTIGSGAFISCSSLTETSLPDTVKRIGNFAFSYCTSLTSVTLPVGIEECGSSLFEGSSGLQYIMLPASVENLPNNVIGYSVDAVILSGNAQCPDSWASGWNNRGLAVVWDVKDAYVDTQGVTYAIKNDDTAVVVAFDSSATELDLAIDGYEITEIVDRAFSNNDGLLRVKIPDTVTKIGNRAFFSCSNLLEVNMPQSLTVIEAEAFCYCNCLNDIVVPKSVLSVGNRAFYGCLLDSITFMSASTEIYDSYDVISGGDTIHGYEGSTAQAYAEKYGYNFVPIVDKELGDVNGDTVVNSDDAVAILRHLAGYDSEGYDIANGDYNSDGVTNSDDAVAILRMLAGYVD